MNEERLIAVGHYNAELEAELAAGLLKNAGIECLLARHDAAGMLPSMQASSQAGFTLLVHPRDFEAARQVIQSEPNDNDVCFNQQFQRGPAQGTLVQRPSEGKATAWAVGILGLLVGFFLGMWFHNVRWSMDGEIVTDTNRDGIPDIWDAYTDGKRISCSIDTDFDGRPDEWFEYNELMTAAGRRDVNLDGSPDTFWTYKEGVIHDGVSDTNFDGKPDQWERFQGGRLSELRHDTDGDGSADVIDLYNRELIAESHWRRAGSVHTWKKILYRDGLREVELVDTDGDGRFDTRRNYDLYDEIVHIEKGVFD